MKNGTDTPPPFPGGSSPAFSRYIPFPGRTDFLAFLTHYLQVAILVDQTSFDVDPICQKSIFSASSRVSQLETPFGNVDNMYTPNDFFSYDEHTAWKPPPPTSSQLTILGLADPKADKRSVIDASDLVIACHSRRYHRVSSSIDDSIGGICIDNVSFHVAGSPIWCAADMRRFRINLDV